MNSKFEPYWHLIQVVQVIFKSNKHSSSQLYVAAALTLCAFAFYDNEKKNLTSSDYLLENVPGAFGAFILYHFLSASVGDYYGRRIWYRKKEDWF